VRQRVLRTEGRHRRTLRDRLHQPAPPRPGQAHHQTRLDHPRRNPA